jgi:hypothetical protein
LIDLFGDHFVTESTHYGNVYLGTGRLAQHVFKRETESLHFVPFAIMFGSIDSLDPATRQFLFHGVCDLLAIFGLLNERTPGFVQNELHERIGSFRHFVLTLRDRIVAKGGPHREITPKMHELFAHVENHINRLGFLPSFSTKIFETFHEQVFQIVESASSGRIEGGAGANDVLAAIEYQRTLAEADVLLRVSGHAGVVPDQAWRPRPNFDVSVGDAQCRMSFQECLRYHFGLITSLLGVAGSVRMPSVFGNDIVGSTLRMSLACTRERLLHHWRTSPSFQAQVLECSEREAL